MIAANEARENAIRCIESIINEDEELSIRARAINQTISDASLEGQSYAKINIYDSILIVLLSMKGFDIVNTSHRKNIHSSSSNNMYTVCWE